MACNKILHVIYMMVTRSRMPASIETSVKLVCLHNAYIRHYIISNMFFTWTITRHYTTSYMSLHVFSFMLHWHFMLITWSQYITWFITCIVTCFILLHTTLHGFTTYYRDMALHMPALPGAAVHADMQALTVRDT